MSLAISRPSLNEAKAIARQTLCSKRSDGSAPSPSAR
jgi:hypothetical protein